MQISGFKTDLEKSWKKSKNRASSEKGPFLGWKTKKPRISGAKTIDFQS